jgi:glycine/D-amino acid oxidase-like deaminating enzyme
VSHALAKRPTGPSRHVYDAVVVGGQLSGALAAALLAKRGCSVLHVMHDAADGWYEAHGYRWPCTPGLLPPLSEEPSFDACLEELGLHTALQRQLRAVPLQLIGLRQRLTLATDDEARRAEFKRCAVNSDAVDKALEQLHQAAKASDDFFAQPLALPPHGFIERFFVGRKLARGLGLNETPQWEHLPTPLRPLERLAPWACFAAQPSQVSRVRALARLAVEPCAVKGGRAGLKEALLERSKELGADVVQGPAAELVCQGNQVTGIRLGDTQYAAGFVIWASDIEGARALMPERQWEKLARTHAPLPLSEALFTLHLALPAKALPRGLADAALVHTPDESLGAVLLQVSSARKEGSGEELSERRLSISARAPVSLRSGGKTAINAFVARLWAALEETLPFTQKHVQASSPVWLDCPSVERGTFEPWPLYEVADRALGVAGLSVRSPLSRLLCGSRQVLPGLGLEGEVLAARQATALICKRLKKVPVRKSA